MLHNYGFTKDKNIFTKIFLLLVFNKLLFHLSLTIILTPTAYVTHAETSSAIKPISWEGVSGGVYFEELGVCGNLLGYKFIPHRYF
jgi:hypothetical protein